MDLKNVNVTEVELPDWVGPDRQIARGAQIVCGTNPVDVGVVVAEVFDGEFGLLLQIVEVDEGDNDDTVTTEQVLDESQALALASMIVAVLTKRHRVTPAQVRCPTCLGRGHTIDFDGTDPCSLCDRTGVISILESDLLNLKGFR